MESLSGWLSAAVDCVSSLWGVISANAGLSAIFGIGVLSASAGLFISAKRAAR